MKGRLIADRFFSIVISQGAVFSAFIINVPLAKCSIVAMFIHILASYASTTGTDGKGGEKQKCEYNFHVRQLSNKSIDKNLKQPNAT